MAKTGEGEEQHPDPTRESSGRPGEIRGNEEVSSGDDARAEPGTRGGKRPGGGSQRKVLAAGETWRDECRVPPPGELTVGELRNLDLAALQAQAESEQVPGARELGRWALIKAILRQRVVSAGFAWGGGVLELLRDGYGFLRQPENNLAHGRNDVYVSPSQVRRFSLRDGSNIYGQIRPPKTGEGYPALLRVELVDGLSPQSSANSTPFEELLPQHPVRRLELTNPAGGITTRVIDLLAPAGFGQRSLIVAPPRAGKTNLIQAMASAIVAAHAEVRVMVVLIDERPEEVTEIRNALAGSRCEVLGCSFDQPASAQVNLAHLVVQRSRRMVEAGMDVVVFLDSLTRLVHACNNLQNQGNRANPERLDPASLERAKAFFGSARETSKAGSLTIFATVLTDTGNPGDAMVLQEFQGTCNHEIVLSRELAELPVWPGIDLGRTQSRRDDLLGTADQIRALAMLRKTLASLPAPEARGWLLGELSRFDSNPAFLKDLLDRQSG